MLCLNVLVELLLLLSGILSAESSSPIPTIYTIRGGENGEKLKRRSRIRLIAIHKHIWKGARSLIGQTAIVFRRGRVINNNAEIQEFDGYVQEDHSFDELDDIFNKSDTHCCDDDYFTETTKPPREAATLKGWKRRSLRAWIRKIEQQFLSPETARAIKTIQKIIAANAHGVVDLFGLYSPKEVILSILALSRLQHVLETRKVVSDEKEELKKNETEIDKSIIEQLAYYSVFANVAYGWKGGVAFCGRFHFGNDRALMRRTGIHQRDILMTSWSSRATRPAFFLVRDTMRNTLVLGIRGTLSPRDVLTDLCASCENFLIEDNPDVLLADEEPIVTGSESVFGSIDESRTTDWGQVQFSRAHSGMVDAAKCVARMTAKIISEELHSDPSLSLVIVGHSLGGGIAAVLATMWKQRFANRVRSIGFGSPCVFPLTCTSSCDNIISVTGEGDPFACISLGHLADLTKALSKICSDTGFREEIIHHTGAKDISEEDYVWCVNAMTFLRKQMDSEILIPPGVIYVMSGSLFDFPSDDSESVKKCKIRNVDPSVFNELRISPRMFNLSHHVPARYETVLQRIAAVKHKEDKNL
jgi:hypothetical protein